MNRKFHIKKRSPAQGNRTGYPWLVMFPPGQKYISLGWVMATCDGVGFAEFEQARAYLARRLNGLR